jgi:hypothetical protein
MADEHDDWVKKLGVSEESFSDLGGQDANEGQGAGAEAGAGTGAATAPVAAAGDAAAAETGGASDDGGTSMFELSAGGIGVMPDPADNPDRHVNPHHDSGTRISFEVTNVGTRGGNARVGVEVDDNFVTEWQSPFLDPGKSAVGFVSLGRLSQGEHTVLIYVNPGSGRSDHQTNKFNVE